MPILDLEVLAKALDVLDQIPGRVLLETRAPAENKIHTHTHKQSVDGSELVVHGQTHGVDFPAPR